MPQYLTSEQRNVEDRPLTTEQQNILTLPTDPWSPQRALAIAKGDFDQSERFRMSAGHDQRFRNADELFLGWCPQQVWEGTRVPKSSIGVPISMDQIEALMPVVMASMFPLRDNVEVWPKPGTTQEEARATYDLLMSQFDDADDDTFVSCREPIRQAFKEGFIYGNGILEIYWKYRKIKRKKQIATWVPVGKTVVDPITGQPTQVLTGESNRVVKEVEYFEEINAPALRFVDIRDFYIDPNCPGPNVQQGRYAAVRALVAIGDLKTLYRGKPGFDIPDDATLAAMANNKTGAYADNLKTSVDTYRGVFSQPQTDFTDNPDLKRLEVVRYYTRDRCVWLLNREWVAYNSCNPVGFLPFINAFYVDVPNRFYGLAVTDVVEGEQRLQQGIINSRVNELALTINPPFAKKRGTSILSSSLRITPGKVIELEDPEHDFKKIEYPGITNNAYIEVDASDRRAQKRTGVTDLGVLGTSSAGGNSAARTATGVNTLSAASGNRITYQVQNLESNFIEPMLGMAHRMNQQFLDPNQIVQVLGDEGKLVIIDPMNVKNANVKFIIRGGEKMKSQGKLLQGLPLIFQTFLNPSLLQQLSEQGMTIDLESISKLVSDAFGIPPNVMFRPLKPGEQQQMMQMRAFPELLKQQSQQQRLQAQSQNVDSNNETKLLHVLLSKLITPEAANDFLKQNMGLQLPSGTDEG